MELIAIVCIICIWNYLKNKKESKDNIKISNVPQKLVLYGIPTLSVDSKETNSDKGAYGEDLIHKEIKGFEIDGGKILRNIYIPREGAESTEIDLVLIYKGGIYVLESKNYSGWIFGSDDAKMWTQCLTQGRNKAAIKNQFLNTIYQNKLHIECLKKLLNDYASGEFSERKREELVNSNFFENKLKKQVPIHSIIVFSERCKLRDIKLTRNDTFVVKINDLKELIFNLNVKYYNCLNDNDIEWIYSVLQSYTMVSENFKEKHIENIRSKKQ